MLKSRAVKSNKYNIPTYQARVDCIENGLLIWSDSLVGDYLTKEDAINRANNEIEYLKSFNKV